MKILILNCSPVRDGATAAIADAIAGFVSRGNEVWSVCIDDYKIALCRGCRRCHETAKCFLEDDAEKLMDRFEWADRIVCVSPSYWADIPGQMKVFIDRCTPWCNTHEPHARLSPGKIGYTAALRTGPGRAECERIIGSIEHFYGHLEIASRGRLMLTGLENKSGVPARMDEIRAFCETVTEEIS